MKLFVGQALKFSQYGDVQRGVPRVFCQGELVVVVEIDGDGIPSCAALGLDGRLDKSRKDTIFPEEYETAIDFVDLP